MKLELKHLVHYLPYGLKAKLSQEGVFNLDAEYRNEQAYSICTITDFTTYSKDLGGSMKVDNTKDYSFDFDSLSEIEIILRPLSDLTKEIEHNGEKFVPIIELARLSNFCIYDNHKIVEKHSFGSADSEASYMFSYNKESISFEIENWNSFEGSSFEFVSNNFELVQLLLEWHFNIFGLIEKGLAVDINTLNK